MSVHFLLTAEVRDCEKTNDVLTGGNSCVRDWARADGELPQLFCNLHSLESRLPVSAAH